MAARQGDSNRQDHTMTRRGALRYLGAGTAAVGLGGWLAACSSDGGTSSSSALPGTSSAGSAAGPITTGSSATGALKSGGSVTAAMPGGPITGVFDAHLPGDGGALQSWAQTAFYEQLMRNKPDPLELENWLAEEITPDATGTVWTIRIREGVEFHHGKTLDADDIIFSLNRAIAPPAFAGLQVGDVTDMRKIDNRTIAVTLATPRGWFRSGVGDGGITGIVPVDYDPTKPVSTGPFKLVEMAIGGNATFERFENYYGTPALLDQLVIQPMDDQAARMNALLAKQIDVYINMSGREVPQVEGNADFTIYQTPGGWSYPMQMRTDTGALADVRVRQALRMVLDREQIVQAALNGYGTVSNDLYATFDPGYTLDLTRVRDVDGARALMEEVGGSVDIELTVLAGDNNAVPVALVVVEQAKEIGINITLNEVDNGTLYGPDYTEWPFLGSDGYPEAHFFTNSALVDAPQAAIGSTHFKDEEFGELWTKGSAEIDPAKQSEYIDQMQQILFDRGGWLLPVTPMQVGAHSATIGGFISPDRTGFGMTRNWDRVGYLAD